MKPETSNQQPATSNQPPATSLMKRWAFWFAFNSNLLLSLRLGFEGKRRKDEEVKLNFKDMIAASRHSIKQDLLAYGENDLAKQIDHLTDEDLNKIGELAMKYIGQGGYISKHIALGAIEFIEGKKREPKRKKRDLAVYDIKEPEPNENVFSRIMNKFKKG